MAKIQPLTEVELNESLQELRNWSVVDGKLHAEFKFKNFIQAFGLMAQVALYAEAMDHHPEWSNVYSRVTIDLVTHEADGAISMLDIELARKIDGLVAQMQ